MRDDEKKKPFVWHRVETYLRCCCDGRPGGKVKDTVGMFCKHQCGGTPSIAQWPNLARQREKKDEKGKKKNARQCIGLDRTLFFWRVSNAAGVALVNMCSHAIQARASFQTFQAWVSAHLNAGGKTREVVWLQEWSSPSFHLVLEHIFYVFEHKWCVLARQRSSPERTCAVATGLGGGSYRLSQCKHNRMDWKRLMYFFFF